MNHQGKPDYLYDVVLINGYYSMARLSKADFQDVNISGTNFLLDFCELYLIYPIETERITFSVY